MATAESRKNIYPQNEVAQQSTAHPALEEELFLQRTRALIAARSNTSSGVSSFGGKSFPGKTLFSYSLVAMALLAAASLLHLLAFGAVTPPPSLRTKKSFVSAKDRTDGGAWFRISRAEFPNSSNKRHGIPA
uniref:Uncharacterized protein n=1 Tax=Anopheles atroparvus TaxID=41427 RepID=A0A182J873_ANOAO